MLGMHVDVLHCYSSAFWLHFIHADACLTDSDDGTARLYGYVIAACILLMPV